MDDYTLKFRDIRAEKANAISKYKRIEKIAAFFRWMEILLVLAILSKFSAQLSSFSSLITFPRECFERISETLISPSFVFLIGNAIVGILVFKSSNTKKGENESMDFYEEYVEKCRSNKNLQEKHNTSFSLACNDHRRRKINRSQSDQSMVRTLHVVNNNIGNKELRRTMTTEKCKKISASNNKVENNIGGSISCMSNNYEEDGMSSEEFRRTVEAFIARQQRCLREE